MRIWILSDLHIESCRWDLPDPRPDYDVLIAAGDIHNPASAGVTWLAERAAGKPVIYVPGNHEWYGQFRAHPIEIELPRARAAAKALGVHFLMNDSIVIDGVRFIGSTLWTDYALNGAPRSAMAWAEVSINDHRMIFPTSTGPAFTPDDALAQHQQDKAFVEQALAERFNGPTVVITHHMPHTRSIHPKYAGNSLNPSFCSDLSDFVENSGAALWVHGHTHTSCDYPAGGTRVVCNPKGYGPRSPSAPVENADFDAHFVVSV
jgi:predicted phosphodiesterase